MPISHTQSKGSLIFLYCILDRQLELIFVGLLSKIERELALKSVGDAQADEFLALSKKTNDLA